MSSTSRNGGSGTESDMTKPNAGRVLEGATFSVTPHRDGAVLAIMCGHVVYINVRLDPTARSLLGRALVEADRAQAAMRRHPYYDQQLGQG